MKKDNDDKIDFLMNKITTLEESYKTEREARYLAEQELKNLKSITLPNLNKHLEEKESLLKALFIEKIHLSKEILEHNNKIDDHVPKLKNNNEIIFSQSKLEFYMNEHKHMKTKIRQLIEEKAKLEIETEDRLSIEKRKREILEENGRDNDIKVIKLSNDFKSLSDSNKNLVIELKSINTLLDELNRQRENLFVENTYYRNELETYKSNLKELQAKYKKLDADFRSMSKNLTEMQVKLSNVEISSHLFNVVRIGRLSESNIEIVFTKDENNLFVLIIKYVTTTYKHNILEIKDISYKEEENLLMIEYKPEKNLDNELFKSHEASAIIKIFKEFQKKAYEQMDDKQIEKLKNKQITKMQKNLNDMLSFP